MMALLNRRILLSVYLRDASINCYYIMLIYVISNCPYTWHVMPSFRPSHQVCRGDDCLHLEIRGVCRCRAAAGGHRTPGRGISVAEYRSARISMSCGAACISSGTG